MRTVSLNIKYSVSYSPGMQKVGIRNCPTLYFKTVALPLDASDDFAVAPNVAILCGRRATNDEYDSAIVAC